MKLRRTWGRLGMNCRMTLSELSVGNKGMYGIAASAVPKRDNLYTYLRITDINDDGTLNRADLKSVDNTNADRYILKPNDIVFARTGGSTGRNYFYDGSDGTFVFAGFLIKFSINENLINPKYIKYFCQTQEYKAWVSSFNTGSTRGNINAQTYGNLEIPLISREKQDKLVKILSVIDDKIEINNTINDNLEQQAQAIFKSWFVDFEPFGGVMPADWATDSLLGIADYTNGLAMQKYRPKDDEDIYPVLKIKELRQGSCDSSSDRCSKSIKSDYIVHDGDVIFSWSGSLMLDFWCGTTCGLNQHLFKVTSSKYDKWFYYFWTNFHLQKFISIAEAKATTMGHIKRGELETSEVLIPDNNSYTKLTNIIQPMLDLIIERRIENRKLAQLRDTLLPRLMNGEIDVSQVEI